jgi:hypothetical protein
MNGRWTLSPFEALVGAFLRASRGNQYAVNPHLHNGAKGNRSRDGVLRNVTIRLTGDWQSHRRLTSRITEEWTQGRGGSGMSWSNFVANEEEL